MVFHLIWLYQKDLGTMSLIFSVSISEDAWAWVSWFNLFFEELAIMRHTSLAYAFTFPISTLT